MKILVNYDNYDDNENAFSTVLCPYKHGAELPQVAMDEMVTRYGV